MRPAFTLIDLLVTIAIIALLFSILLVSLVPSRDLAKNLRCQANLHEVAMTTNIYVMNYHILPGLDQMDLIKDIFVCPSNMDSERIPSYLYPATLILVRNSNYSPQGFARSMANAFENNTQLSLIQDANPYHFKTKMNVSRYDGSVYSEEANFVSLLQPID